jgi:serine/threonine protein kinase
MEPPPSSTIARAAAARLGQVVGGRWTLERVLGSGGMADVYAARDATGVLAAVKVLQPEVLADEEVRQRFCREARVAESLDHPNIVRVIEQNTNSPESAYIAMELLEGETLAERVQRTGTLPGFELLGVVDQVLDALALAHERGIIHRDLKPANLFIARGGTVKLLDFGVARLLDPTGTTTKTRLGFALGTVSYMAPEQAQGKHDEIDPRTDIFALGAILFRLAAGRPVHVCDTNAATLAAMATKPAPPLLSVCSSASPHLVAIVDTCLAFSRDRRYPGARLMQADVRAALAGSPPPFATSAKSSSEQATFVPAGEPPPSSVATDPTMLPGTAAPVTGEVGGSSTGSRGNLVGQVVGGRYQIEQLLGTGGMGSVYRAMHVHMRKTMALKVLHRELTSVPEVVARFEREAVAAARIEHECVASATDFGKLEDGSFYLVLEFIQGRSLRELLDAERVLPAARALHIAAQVARALEAAHALDIVHRDLKPDNVMLVNREGNADAVKVLDFGIAKVLVDEASDQPLTQIGAVFGTPEYMSPQQAVGKGVDQRSDLYSVGVMLYEMLAGTTPFKSGDMMAVLSKQLTSEPPPLPAGTDPEIVALVMRLLAKEVDARVQSASELVAWIGRIAPNTLMPAAGTVAPGFSPTALGVPPGVGSPGASTTGPRAAGGVKSVKESLQELRASFIRTFPVLERRLTLKGLVVPVWGVVLGAGGVLLAAILVLGIIAAIGGGDGNWLQISSVDLGPRLELPPPKPLPEPDDERRLRTELELIEALPVYKRTEQDWLALARGRARLGQHKEAVAGYRAVLSKRSSYANDPQTLADLRRAAEDPDAYKIVINLCETRLRKHGLELLYDLWLGTRDDDSKAMIAEMAHKKMRILSRRAFPATRIAIDLEFAKGCDKIHKLLPRALKYGDQRSVERLSEFSETTGCGPGGKEDCYPCLRQDDLLAEALAKAEKRAVPKLGSAVE